MSRNRRSIKKDILKVTASIKKLNEKLIALRRESLLFSDRLQRYSEEDEEHVVSRRPKVVETIRVGRIHWKESFKDESTGKVTVIERSRIVRENGEWVYGH